MAKLEAAYRIKLAARANAKAGESVVVRAACANGRFIAPGFELLRPGGGTLSRRTPLFDADEWAYIHPFMQRTTKLSWVLLISPMWHMLTEIFSINSFNLVCQISWTNAFTSGVCTVETAAQLNGTNGHTAWTPQQNYFTTNSAGVGGFTFTSSNGFFRLLAVNISSNTPQALHESGAVLRYLAHHRR